MSRSRVGMSMRQATYSALNNIAVQGVAVLVLVPADYGRFAIAYIVLGLAYSLTYSTVSEAWTRTGASEPWPRYCTALGGVVLLGFLFSAAATLVVGSPLQAALAGGAVAMSTYRSGARYYSVAAGHSSRVGPADLLGATTMVGVFLVVSQTEAARLDAVLVAWFLSAAASALASESPRFDFAFGILGWIRAHGRAIRVLLADSSLMDLGVTGVPLLLAPLMGVANFGVYRAVSSAAIPVRLVLSPIRPLIGLRPIRFYARRRVVAGAAGAGLLVGAAIVLILLLIKRFDWFPSGILSELAVQAAPVGLFVASSFMGTLYYLVARSHMTGRSLLIYRGLALVGAVAMPISGFFVGGLSGAIWGFTIDSVAGCFLIVGLICFEARRQPSRCDAGTGQ